MSFPSDSPDYSSRLNPHLRTFLDRLSSSDASSQDINFSYPFVNNFESFKKSGPVYSMHRYWTKQPIDIIKHFINYFCPPDGIVLDPFCGTGTAGTAALFSQRPVILSDLSPIATFIAKNYTEQTDIPSITKAISTIKVQLYPILEKFYSTTCPTCSSPASVRDWIYAENFLCPDCSSTIPFINNINDWSSITSSKHSKTVQCPDCSQSFNKNILVSTDPSPLGLRYSCSVCKIRKLFKTLSPQDKALLQDSVILKHQASLVKTEIPLGPSTNQAINKNILFVNQFFTPVTFYILTKLWDTINSFDEPTRTKLQFLFTSIMYRVTKLYRLRVKGQGGILSGTLYVPPLFQDINVWDVFLERFRKISKGWLVLNEHLPDNVDRYRIISTHSATDLPLPANSIDYVYTDPPYGGNINYSELNFLWEYWFQKFTDRTNEVIINEIGQNKDLAQYEKLFSSSLAEIYRVLKPGRWCSLVFNSSSFKVWSSIQRIITESSFFLSADILSLDSNMTTAKQTQSLRTARRYMVLNLFKPTQGPLPSTFTFVPKSINFPPFSEDFIITEVHNLFKNSNNQSLGYNQIYEYIIPLVLTKFNFMDFDLENILYKNFKPLSSNRWSLL